MQGGLLESHDHFRNDMSSRAGPSQQSPSPTSCDGPRVTTRSRQHGQRSVTFTPALRVYCYPPEVWGDDEEVEDDDSWDVHNYEDEDPSLAEEAALAVQEHRGGGNSGDGMGWEGVLDPSRARGPAEEQRRQRKLQALQLQKPLWQQQEAEQQAALQHQPQRQRIEEQRQQQRITAHTIALHAAAASTQGSGGPSIRHHGTREQPVRPQDSSSISARAMDHIDASGTKTSMTPLLVQGHNQRSQPPRQAPPRFTDPIRPSELMQRQGEGRRRTREEIGSLEEAALNRAKQPSSSRPQGGAKFRKEPRSRDDDSSRENNKKGKSGGLFGRLFGRRKNNHKEKGTNDSVDISRPIGAHSLEDSGWSSDHTDITGGSQTPPQRGPALTNTSSPVFQHASSLRQRDKEQQALYQRQYLTRSPASPPELRVIRIFAGKRLQTEATFKTVLLNSSTSSEELVKQAIQRFRLPAGEDATDYYLTVKGLEGSSAVLRPEEKPLVAFETLVEAALDLPKVKRSSVGSISSIASNLSQHPAVKKLPMNDFTDDTAVKLYLNRGFELQLLICPDDLPDDMVFDTLTEAIVFKDTLRDRTQAPASSAPFRRKILRFPESITVAEVIKASLKRFGIPHGVVAGGDEVEDKNTTLDNSARVRYVLKVPVDGIGGCVLGSDRLSCSLCLINSRARADALWQGHRLLPHLSSGRPQAR